jgi:hypothetical protein
MINKAHLFVTAALVILLFAIFGWWLIGSSKTSNSSLAIKLRYNYYSVLWPKLGLSLKSMPFDIMPTLKVQDEAGYVYTMLGMFVNADIDNQVIYVQTKSGDIYGFNYSIEPAGELIYREKIGDSFEDISFYDKPFSTDEALLIQWSDVRKLEEITKEANLDDRYHLVNPYIGTTDYLSVIKMK